MSYQPDASKIDWEGTKQNAVDAIEKMRIAWAASHKGLPAQFHQQFVDEAFVPVMRKLAEFCIAVDSVVSVDGDPDER